MTAMNSLKLRGGRRDSGSALGEAQRKIQRGRTNPRRTSAPHTQTGIMARLTTMLRLASTYSASASRRKRPSRSATFIGVRTASDASKSNSASRSVSESAVSDGMLVGTRSSLKGLMAAYSGRRTSVCGRGAARRQQASSSRRETTLPRTSSLAFLKVASMSSSGFHTRGTPCSS